MIKGVDVLLEGPGLRDNPVLRGESGDQAFPPPTIRHGVEECRIGITFEEPVEATPLSPILLLETVHVGEMSLHVVTKGPSFIVQAYSVGASV
jgi:hypothetical protein